MENTIVTEALNEMCANTLEGYPNGPRDFYIYAEVSDGVIAPSLVQIYTDHVFWIVPWNLGKPLYRIWQNAADDKKWQAMTLEIRDGKFDAQFLYDPARQFDEETDARSMAAMHERFPDLPIRHPPYDPDALMRDFARRRGVKVASFELDPQKDSTAEPDETQP
jgi:hypothetical protein